MTLESCATIMQYHIEFGPSVRSIQNMSHFVESEHISSTEQWHAFVHLLNHVKQ